MKIVLASRILTWIVEYIQFAANLDDSFVAIVNGKLKNEIEIMEWKCLPTNFIKIIYNPKYYFISCSNNYKWEIWI